MDLVIEKLEYQSFQGKVTQRMLMAKSEEMQV